MKILLVEDEKTLSNTLKQILVSSGYEVSQAFDGEEAIFEVTYSSYSLIIMDVMMPKLDGLSALKKIRSMGKTMPIIMLTAKSEIEDKVQGLDLGADDYLSKPFQTSELLARIRALLRRGENIINKTSFHDLTLDPNNYTIKCKNKSATLTKKEFQLLEYLIYHQDRFSETEKILDDLWGDDNDVYLTVVWVYISNIRKKLKEIESKVVVDAQRGVGYKINV